MLKQTTIGNSKPLDFLLIDGSYYCFYRYYALHSWWKLAKPEEELNDPSENEDFIEKYKKTFIEKIKEISKKLKLNNPVILVGADCPRKEIWRMSHYNSYKENRDKDDSHLAGKFFQIAYNENLFIKAGVGKVLKHDKLEADDCLAITTKHILNKYSNCRIFIIASDMDYLQLAEERVNIYDLKYKNISEKKSSSGDSKKDLMLKILVGDKSDNILPVFEKCGKKTAEKLCNLNEDDLFEVLKKKGGEKAIENYKRNKLLVDFNNIPEELVSSFKNTCLNIKS
jgi:5'-3' exonuclease